MFFKLVFKNVTKSMRDYTIYFLTLLFGVCLFYMFNSIDAQTSLLKLSEDRRDLSQTLIRTMDYISVFISVVLGFLVVYANGFLMKRRKHELGVYMVLGMPKSKISILITLETFLIGMVSLAAGLVLGVFASQGMSVVTARLFEADMTSFRFIFSQSAFRKTLLYFGIIFLVVILFNVLSVSRVKLISLLNAGRKNQKFHIRRLWVSVLVFLLSVACLAAAYRMVIKSGLSSSTPWFTASIVLGCAGTLLFFLSLSGLLLRAVQSNRKLYFRNLNMFVLRQFHSKINTTFVSVSVICLMLFFTISALSVGIGVSGSLSADLKETTPFDASLEYFYHAYDADKQIRNLAQQLKNDGIDLDRYAERCGQVTCYVLTNGKENNIGIGSLMCKDDAGQISKEQMDAMPLTVISLSDCNRLLSLQGKPPVSLGKSQYAVFCNYQKLMPLYNRFLRRGGSFSYGGKTLVPARDTILEEALLDMSTKSNSGTLIVPDSFLRLPGVEIESEILNIQYRQDVSDAEFLQVLDHVYTKEARARHAVSRPYDYYNTKVGLYRRASGNAAIGSYLTLYVGLVFLIAAAAVLALQQLSEASDNTERYGLLRRLGAEDTMVNHALFLQIALYFLLPLLLAVVHSAVGIHVATSELNLSGLDVRQSSFITAIIILVVYGAYFLATYFGSKNMIRQKEIYRR
jgi:putative ABC transport system permease protein